MSHSSDTLHARFSEQIFSNTQVGLILLDRDANIVKLTVAAAQILGGEPESFIHKNMFELFKHLSDDRQLVTKSVLDGYTLRNKTMSWHNGKRQFELLVDTYPVSDSQQKLLGVSVFLKDVTSVRSLENQIRHNERLAMIGQMAAGTAHEIRNPLTSIKGFLQIIKQTLGANNMAKETEYTHIMLEEIERINHLVGEFLLLSRSRESAKYEKVHIADVIQQILPMVQSEALLHGVEVKAQDFGTCPLVLGEQELLKQVFLNLCKNAIEAMQGEGTLTISHQIMQHEQMLSIDFQDTGPGIPAYVLDKIFEPFFTTKEEGTGLGLSICQRIVHDMGGKISVSSKGFGTIFHVQIPFVAV